MWIVSRFTWREPEEVAVVERRVGLERLLQRHADGVLDEPGLEVRVLDDEQLVGPLEELVDRRAHRPLDDRDELLRVDRLLGADVERAAAALVVRRERDELEDPVDVARSNPASSSRSDARPRTSPWAHGQALIPVASTPTTRRTAPADAAAIPISETISWVAQPGDRGLALERVARGDLDLGA